MNYEKKYKEALEEAKKLYGKYCINNVLEDLFPELKESKDERIRKMLHAYIHDFGVPKEYFEDIEISDVLAWLEKQGEKKHIINVPPREVILSIWDLGNEWKELTNGCISTEYGTQLDYIQKHWHESEYYLKEKQGKQTQLDYEHADIPQKDFAPIEPKFKVGDWITNGDYIWKIVEVTPLDYILQSQDGNRVDDTISYVDKQFHSFTIEDAKDGDVLVAKDVRPFIFTGEFDVQDDNPTAYCGINSSDKFITGKGSHWTFKDGIKPATKEQRELLFSKMKEAGYEWDAEKKEVKKIEVASKESEDERMLREIKRYIKEQGDKPTGLPNGTVPVSDMIAWLEKQGKEEYALKLFKDEDIRKFMQYIEKQAKAYDFNLPNRGYDIYAFAKDILTWLEKQKELKDKGEISDGYHTFNELYRYRMLYNAECCEIPLFDNPVTLKERKL